MGTLNTSDDETCYKRHGYLDDEEGSVLRFERCPKNDEILFEHAWNTCMICFESWERAFMFGGVDRHDEHRELLFESLGLKTSLEVRACFFITIQHDITEPLDDRICFKRYDMITMSCNRVTGSMSE